MQKCTSSTYSTWHSADAATENIKKPNPKKFKTLWLYFFHELLLFFLSMYIFLSENQISLGSFKGYPFTLPKTSRHAHFAHSLLRDEFATFFLTIRKASCITESKSDQF